MTRISAIIKGVPATLAVNFYTGGLVFFGGAGGGLFIDPSAGANIDLYGPQLFTGSLSSPTMKLGTFYLATNSLSYLFGDTPYKLTATTLTAATPEPSTLLLVSVGGLTLVLLKLERVV